MAPEPSFRVAIVGSGIVGITFAHTLLARSIEVHVYEQSSTIRTTGGGINAHEAGVRALKRCSPECYAAYREVGVPHHKTRPDLFMSVSQGGKVVDVISKNEFGSMPRINFLEAMAARLPQGTVELGRKVRNLVIRENEMIKLEFEDGRTETADIVVGCDGMNSSIRSYVVGDEYGATFAECVMCRGLLPAKKVRAVLGEHLIDGAHVGCGKGDGYVAYPVNEELMNVGYFYEQLKPWSSSHKMTRTELIKIAKATSVEPRHVALVELFPEDVNTWGMLHVANKLPTYNKGRVAVMGDAAHGSTPFLSSGAGQGYEDAAVCAELLDAVVKQQHSSKQALYSELERALDIYSENRIPRSQAVTENSYKSSKLVMGSKPFDEAVEEYNGYVYEALHGDMDSMVNDALQRLSSSQINGRSNGTP